MNTPRNECEVEQNLWQSGSAVALARRADILVRCAAGAGAQADKNVRAPASKRAGFTLVEMIVVTGIIAVLAAMIFPIAGVIRRTRDLKRARTELMLVSGAIQGYKDKLGHYPPDNTLATDPNRYADNPLYYELFGMMISSPGSFRSLDGSTTISTNTLFTAFGVDGVINCTRGAGGDESQPAAKFLTDLKAGQYVDAMVNGVQARLLGCPLDGQLAQTDSANQKVNPWQYNSSSPTNNPNGFDLWVDVQVGSKIYRISNWNNTYQRMN